VLEWDTRVTRVNLRVYKSGVELVDIIQVSSGLITMAISVSLSTYVHGWLFITEDDR
jgi:hypothetical protein